MPGSPHFDKVVEARFKDIGMEDRAFCPESDDD